MRPVLTPQPLGVSPVHDLEAQRELGDHLLGPLLLQRGGADHQDAADALAGEQLLDHHACLDGLAQAHVVGQQHVHARHAQRPHNRLKLVVLYLDGPPERSLQRKSLKHRGERPAAGQQERLEPSRWIPGVRPRQPQAVVYHRVDLVLPDDVQGFPHHVVIHGLQPHPVLSGLAWLDRSRPDVLNYEVAVTNTNQLALFWDCDCSPHGQLLGWG